MHFGIFKPQRCALNHHTAGRVNPALHLIGRIPAGCFLMTDFTTKPLTEATWPDFPALVEKHNGIWGGCWCIGFHQKPGGDHRAQKECRVREGRAHASLVYEGDAAVGWCQFGSPEELPRIKHRKRYEGDLERLPDWRITCFFVDKEYRGKGVTSAALAGALEQISALGGGLVESYPEDAEGRKTAGAFLYNGTVSIFERQGFERIRQIGMHHWVVQKTIGPQS